MNIVGFCWVISGNVYQGGEDVDYHNKSKK